MKTHTTAAALLLLAAALGARAESVRTYVTRADGKSLLKYSETSTTSVAAGATVRLLPEESHQTMDGFGYAITYSSCYNLLKMAPRERAEFLRRTYSPDTGLGVSYARISIGCSDFSSTEYTLCDEPGLEHFRLHTDETRYVIPVLKEILAINPGLKIMAAPWTCPRWMKVRTKGGSWPYGDWVGGYLGHKYMAQYAQYFVKFVEAFRAEGIDIYAVTPQNEPLNWGNCASLYLPWDDEAALISEMAPAFKKAGLSTRIYCFDHNYNYDNKADQEDYPVKVFNALSGQLEGSELVVGSAWHDYGGSPEELDDINAKLPGKESVFTESSIGEWNDGRDLAKRLTADMKHIVLATVTRGCRAVMVWNLMLDLAKGPNLDGGCTTCYGAVDIDQSDYHTITPNSHYYILAHASAVVRPGAARIGSEGSGLPEGVSHAAFRNPDGSLGTLLVNDGTTARTICVYAEKGKVARCLLPAKSVASVLIGGAPPARPSLGGEPLRLEGRGSYSLTADMEQGRVYGQDFMGEGEGWYADPDFFARSADGSLTFRPLSGPYTLRADLNGRRLTAEPQGAGLDAGGQGNLYVNGPRESVGKPCVHPGRALLAANAMPMAELEDGLYQITFTAGEQLSATDVDFAFYASPEDASPLPTGGDGPRLAYQTDAGSVGFGLGTGSMGRADGHVYLRAAGGKLRAGTDYVASVDLRGGAWPALVRVTRLEDAASGVSRPSARRVAPGAPRGVRVRRGAKTLE